MMSANVMVVEDERIIALDLSQRLKKLGYNVVGTAATGPDALSKAESLKPEVILMDIHLEGAMDGTEAARLIHERIGTPVIFLSAYSEDDTIQKALVSSPFGYLVKPVHQRELHTVLQTTLARHASEQELKRSEERLQIALHAANMGVWEWEFASGRFSASGMLKAMLGAPPNMMNENIENFLVRLHPEDRSVARHQLTLAISNGKHISASFRYIDAQGLPGWLEIHARVAHGMGGQRLIGAVKDVTERHKMEEDLRQSAAVFETIAEGLFILSAEGRMISANPAFESLTGYKLVDIVGRNPDDLLRPRRHGDHIHPDSDDARRGTIINRQGEAWYRRKNGEMFPAWESIRAVLDSDGEISHYVAAISDISMLRRAEEQVNFLAYHDPLTGLANRGLLNDRLDRYLEHTAEELSRCAVIFIDLDGFKSVNDRLGHATGDLLLRMVAARLRHAVRSSDTVARLGGDEFVVVLTNLTRPEEASDVADKLLAECARAFELEGEEIQISASIGVAFSPENGHGRDNLIRAADMAMYSAKAHGKNQVCCYTPEMAASASERLDIEQGMRRALTSSGFILHYQPQYRLVDGTLVGVEALVRWPHPRQGTILPGMFIPVAEETGLISALGAWVLRAACEEIVALTAEGGNPPRLAINVSARQMQNGDAFLCLLRKVLEETKFPARQLEIEITESTLQRVEHSRVLLEGVRALGVRIGIDDFGTGYSSLSVLKNLPIDVLKIDRSFVRDLPHSAQAVGIVEAIITMGRKLNLRLIAEGVENRTQLDLLRELGCDEVQGFLLCRPVPWQELARPLSGIILRN